MPIRRTIFVDGSPLVINPQGGIGHYTQELIAGLAREEDYCVYVVLFKNDSINPSLPDGVTLIRVPMIRKVYMALWRLFPLLNVGHLLKLTPDVMIYPNFSMTPYIASRHTKSITVIHDLTLIHYPETVEWKNRLFLKLAIKRSVKHSKLLITPSLYTKKDIQATYGGEDNILVANPGYTKSSNTVSIAPVANLIDEDYILFLGTIEPRKNISELCKGFLASECKEHFKLVLAGSVGWGAVEIPDDDHIIAIGKVTDSEREYLYEHASAFLFPSLFEGFGMPIIEAMQHDVPVITARNSSLSEIANEKNAYLVNDTNDSEAIKSSLNKFLSDQSKDSEKIFNMTLQAKNDTMRYTWKNCTDVFKRAIDKL